MEGMNASMAICMCWQNWDLRAFYLFYCFLFSRSIKGIDKIGENPKEELAPIIDDLQGKENHEVPKLNHVDILRKYGSILKSSNKEGQL